MSRINQVLLTVTIIFLMLIFCCVALTNLFFATGFLHFEIVFPFASICTLILSWRLSKRFLAVSNQSFVFSSGLSFTLFLIFEFIALSLYDISWDGQAYHLEAVLKMSEGWNPIYSQLDNSAKLENIFINHYPRGGWYESVSLFALTGKIEGVKVFNYLWFIITWFSCCALLNRFFKFSLPLAFFVSLLVAANPVFLYQGASNYVDGQVAMSLTLIIVLSAFIFFTGNFLYSLLLIITISFSLNLKFTLPFYISVILAGIILLFVYHRNFIAVRKLIVASIAGFVLGIFVLGFSPYITNTIRYSNPIYPIADKSQDQLNADIENSIAPVSFHNMNRVQRLFESIFSKGVWSRTPNDNVLKIPGTFSENEIMNYVRPDPDVAGMGPFYSLAFVLSVLALFILFFFDRKIFFTVLISVLIIFLSVIVTTIGWLARFAPQFYLIPIAIVIGLLLVKTKTARVGAFICLIVLLINDFSIANFYYTREAKYSSELDRALDTLSERKDTVHVFFNRFESNRERLKEKKINFIQVKNISDMDSSSLHFLPSLNHTVACD